MRLIGLDYGSVTCGVAVSDETNTIATPIETIKYKSLDELINKIKEFMIKYNTNKIVLGNPINLDGSISTRSEKTFELKKELENYGAIVYLEDERLTTVIVNNMLIEGNVKRQNRKKVVDKLAASVILQTFLDRSNNGK